MSEDVFNTDSSPIVPAAPAAPPKHQRIDNLKGHRLKKGEARAREIGKLGGEASANRTILDAAVVKEISPQELSLLIRACYEKAVKGNLPYAEFIMKHLNLITAKSTSEVKITSQTPEQISATIKGLLSLDNSKS